MIKNTNNNRKLIEDTLKLFQEKSSSSPLILVTGGTGFLGKEIIKELLKKNYRIRTISRNKNKLIELKKIYPSIEIIEGNICDISKIKKICKNVTGILHLATYLKSVLSKENTLECVETNIIGTLNILKNTLNNNKLKFIIGISSTKAINIKSTYGASKYIIEQLFKYFMDININIKNTNQQYNLDGKDTKVTSEDSTLHCKYILIRLGNIINFTNSVINIWKNKLKKGEEIIITNDNSTRYYIPLKDAINFILKILDKEFKSDSTYPSPIKDNITNPIKIYIPKMKSMRLGDILEVMIKKYLPKNKPLKLKKINLLDNENLHEYLENCGISSNDSPRYNINEIYKLI